MRVRNKFKVRYSECVVVSLFFKVRLFTLVPPVAILKDLPLSPALSETNGRKGSLGVAALLPKR